MAVTITVIELLAALRLGDTDEEVAQATRLLAYATTAVTKHAPNAPAEILNESVVRLAGYLFDQPFVGRGSVYSNSIRNSGASSILLPYRIHRAGAVGGAIAAPQDAVGTAGDVELWARTGNATLIPAGKLANAPEGPLLTRRPGTRRRLLWRWLKPRTLTRRPGTRRRRRRKQRTMV